jgi:hypothetical protein
MTATVRDLIESLPAATGFPAERGQEIASALQAAGLLPSDGAADQRAGVTDAVRLLLPILADAAPSESAKVSNLLWSMPRAGVWQTIDRHDGAFRIDELDSDSEWVEAFVPRNEAFAPFLIRVLARYLVVPDASLDPQSIFLDRSPGTCRATVRFRSSPAWAGPSMQISVAFNFASLGAFGAPDDAPAARITRTAEIKLTPLIKVLGDLLLAPDEKLWIDSDRKVRAALGGNAPMEGR